MTIITKVITGGQSGCDQAALRAAKVAKLPTGGWCPLGYLTETGPAPWLATYGLVEASTPEYPERTRLNVADADAILWFGDPYSPGGRLTIRHAAARPIPYRVVKVYDIHLGGEEAAVCVAKWVMEALGGTANGTLMIAGNRESSASGIGARVEAFLGMVFGAMRVVAPAPSPTKPKAVTP